MQHSVKVCVFVFVVAHAQISSDTDAIQKCIRAIPIYFLLCIYSFNRICLGNNNRISRNISVAMKCMYRSGTKNQLNWMF